MEILSPAGDILSAKAAIHAGADAVYLGGKNFSARNLAENFTLQEIEEIIDYAALRGVKIYITLNTLYNDAELPRVMTFAESVYKMGAAAFIVQDIGLAALLRKRFSDIRLHASTQLNVHSAEGAKYMESIGFSRVVLARELSLREISQIYNETRMEIEVFAHGAVCYSYSGQCLFSAMLGGRSGNRGKCAQPCRLQFELLRDNKSVKSGHLLSTKDMMTLEFLDGISAAGVASLKIEGRMKSPEYVYLTTQAYRSALSDELTPSAVKNVTQVFNRGGSFSSSYFNGGGLNMMSTATPKSTGIFCGTVVKYVKGKCHIRFREKMVPGDGIEIRTVSGSGVGTGISKAANPNDIAVISIEGRIAPGDDVYKSYDKHLADETKRAAAQDTRKTQIMGFFEARVGKPLKLILRKGEITAEYESKTLTETARTAAITQEEILLQLSKMGGSPFAVEFESVDMDENIFINKQSLNELRREAIAVLESNIIASIKRSANVPLREGRHECTESGTLVKTQKFTVQLKNMEALPVVLEQEPHRIYVDFTNENVELTQQHRPTSTEIFFALPSICNNDDEKSLAQLIAKHASASFDGFLVATHGQLRTVLGTGKQIALDHNFNIFNNHAKNEFAPHITTLSAELSAKQLKHISGVNSEIIVYGKQVLMTVCNCPIGMYGNCRDGGKYALLDRKDAKFPITPNCQNCTAQILNSKTLDTAARLTEIKNTGIEFLRLIFTNENIQTTKATLGRYKKHLEDASSGYHSENANCTYGLFFRGVE